jgi:hypothetical protein
MKPKSFTTGLEIQATGIYRIKHGSHELPTEVVLHQGQQFPGCSKCDDAILFELIHAAPYAFSDPDFRVALPEPLEFPALTGPADKRRQAV